MSQRRYIDQDEWWPVYSAHTPGETFAHLVTPGETFAHLVTLVEFTDEEATRIDAAFEEFADVQELIRTRYEANK